MPPLVRTARRRAFIDDGGCGSIDEKDGHMSIEQLYLPPGGGETLSLRGTELVLKATGEREGGGPTVIEFIAAPGFSTGDHVHSKIEEILYVVDGEFNLRSGEWAGIVPGLPLGWHITLPQTLRRPDPCPLGRRVHQIVICAISIASPSVKFSR